MSVILWIFVAVVIADVVIVVAMSTAKPTQARKDRERNAR